MSSFHHQRDCILCKSKQHDEIILAMVVEQDEFIETFRSGVDELGIYYNHIFDENQQPTRNSLEIIVRTKAGKSSLNIIKLTKKQFREFAEFKRFGIIHTGALELPPLHEFELIIDKKLSDAEFELIGNFLKEMRE